MPLASLLVCSDAGVVQVLNRILADLGIDVEVCGDWHMARARLDDQRFDALLIDCHDEEMALEFIANARRKANHRSSAVIAIVDGDNHVREAFARGANFVLYKPISPERAEYGLRAAHTLLQDERRVKPRIPLAATASIAYPGTEGTSADLANLSEHGIGLRANAKMPPCCKVYFQFALPEHTSVIRLSGELMWQDSSGRMGVRFEHVPPSSKRVLQDWLEKRPSVPAADAPVTEGAHADEDVVVRLSTGLGLLSAPAPNRRDRERHPCRLGAEVYRPEHNAPSRCVLTDIGSNGCFLETTDPFPVGTPLEIVVRTGDLKVRVPGKVKSANPGFGMGVEFVPNEQQGKQIQDLIACAQSESKFIG
jgi:CheY-like chemotaxis protein